MTPTNRRSRPPDDKRATLRICAERCSECLFSPDRVVSPQRMAEVLAEADASDTGFECHKHTLRKRETPELGGVICRGYYDRDPGATFLLRLGAMLDVVEFVDETGNPVAREPGDLPS